jgi:hypothetical protein
LGRHRRSFGVRDACESGQSRSLKAKGRESRKEEILVSSFFFCYIIRIDTIGGTDVKDLVRKLTVLFGVLVGIAAVFFAVVYYIYYRKITVTAPLFSIFVWGVILLVLTVLFSAALPILMRTLFHSTAVKKKKAEFVEYEKLQINLIIVHLIGAYTACLACLFLVPRFHLYASVIAGLYGIYAAIPNRKKISADLKYYGLEEMK